MNAGLVIMLLSTFFHSLIPYNLGGVNIYLIIGLSVFVWPQIYFGLSNFQITLILILSLFLVRVIILQDELVLHALLIIISCYILIIATTTPTVKIQKLAKISPILWSTLVLSVAYSAFRMLNPYALKVDYLNSNFIMIVALFGLIFVLDRFYDPVVSAMYKLIYLSIFLIYMVTLFWTSSRFGVIIGLLIVFVKIASHSSRFIVRLFFEMIIGVIMLISVFSTLFPVQMGHVQSRMMNELTFSTGKRVVQIQEMLDIVEYNPEILIFGFGDNFNELNATSFDSGFSDNSLLEMTAYFGFLPSFLILIFILIIVFKKRSIGVALLLAMALLSYNFILWLPAVAGFCLLANERASYERYYQK